MRYFVYCVLALSLVACTQDNASNKAPSPKVTQTATQTPKNLLPDEIIPPIFTNLGDCEKSGASLPSCARAQNVARVMAQLDAPKFSSQENCAKVFQHCASVSGKFLPQFTSFGLGGNATSSPSPEDPAQITPVYTTKSGTQVVILGTSSNVYNAHPTDGKTPPFSFQAQ